MRVKQILTLVLALVLCIGLLAACGATEAPAQPTVPATTEAQATTMPETVPPETAETAEATEPAENVDLLEENQRKINLFLSNFAETYFEEYPCSEYDMLMFGFIHSKINSSKTLKYDDYVECINKKDMDTVLKDYFDKTIKPDEEGELFCADEDMDWYVTFDGSRYEIDAADGESYDYMAVAKSMVDNGDGTYKVEFDIYYAEDGLKSSYYDFNLAQAAKSSKLERTKRGTAIVKEHTRSNGKESYALIKYTLK